MEGLLWDTDRHWNLTANESLAKELFDHRGSLSRFDLDRGTISSEFSRMALLMPPLPVQLNRS